ncbi:MAG: PAS domain-containing protein [Nitrospirota bacterium]|nr:PAS domain-containing protein [Nitrospirota bacterium]
MGNNPYLKHVEILLQIIVEAQFKFVNDASCHSSFDHVLENLLELTHSQYGFIGEVLTNEQGTPPFKTLAISNVAWNEETRNLYDQLAPNLELSHLDALFEKVIVSGQHVIANGPGSNPRCGPLPKEHPPLHAFLGVPFFHGSKMVGMVGIANRPGGYDEQMVEFLKPLLTFCGTVLQAHRNECNRRKTEVAGREIEERVSLALDASGSGVWDWNVQTGQVYYSQNWIESLGYKPREVPPNIKFWENLVHPDDLPKVNARLSEHFEGKTEIYECENRLRMASGGWRWDVNRGRVIEWDREGSPLRMVGVDKDISHRKFLEEKNLTLQYALDLWKGRIRNAQ